MRHEQYDQQFIQFCQQAGADQRFRVRREDQNAILCDDVAQTDVHYSWGYLAHTSWAARQLARSKPERHVDIGSYVYFAGIASAFIPEFIFLDIRPLKFQIDSHLKTDSADLKNLNIPSNSIKSLSCLHTLEHVGLGRYGDEIDAMGDVRAANELMRVLAPGGELLMVLPCWESPRVCFNAHRFYSFSMARKMFAGLQLRTHAWLYGDAIHTEPNPPAGQYDACFAFVKP